MSATQSSAQQQQAVAAAQNMQARQAVLKYGVGMTQNIFSQTFVPGQAGVLNIIPRNVGLIRGFWVQLTGTINNPTGSVALAASSMNLANLLSQIVFTDLSNYTRINTTGWHLSMLDSVKKRRPFNSAFTTDDPRGFGNNYPVNVMPATLAANASGAFETWYYIPLAYSDIDLRGAVYANIINATMNLQLTVNPNVAVPLNSDSTLALMVGTASGTPTATISTMTINVFQDFLDQIPMGQQGAILPLSDLSKIYELKNTSVVGLAQGQDFPIPYTNFRQFMSTFFIFDNGGTLNAGTDINYIALQSANFTNIFKVPPHMLAIWTRNRLQTDVPKGMYYLDSRHKPITTQQYGNMELIINPSTVNTGAQVLVAYEDFGSVNTLIPAGSLPGG